MAAGQFDSWLQPPSVPYGAACVADPDITFPERSLATAAHWPAFVGGDWLPFSVEPSMPTTVQPGETATFTFTYSAQLPEAAESMQKLVAER